jgi:hypothetical protein
MGDSSSLSSRFSYYELEIDSLGAVTSMAAGVQPSNWPQVFFNDTEYNPAGIKVISAEVPFVFDTISSSNNTFIINYGVGDVVVAITPGTYNSEELRIELQTRLLAITIGWTVSYNSFSFKYTIQYTGPWSITFTQFISPDINLGFADTTYVSTGNAITSPFAASASGPNYLYLNSNTIGPSIKSIIQDNSRNITQLCRIPISVQKGSLILYNDPNPNNFFDFVVGTQFGSFDLFLTLGYDQAQRPLDMKGLGFSCKIGLLNYRNGGIPIGQARSEGRGGVSFLNP